MARDGGGAMISLGVDLLDEVPSQFQRARAASMDSLGRVLRRPGLLLAWIVVILVALAAIFPDLFSSQSPLLANPVHRLQPPSWHHLFGTDDLGRDEFSRAVHGAALSMRGGLEAVGVSLVCGSLIGLCAGFFGGLLDDLLMRAMDVMMSIPALMLALLLLAVFGFGITQVAFAVGVAGVGQTARIMRSQVLRIKSMTYVDASRSMGERSAGTLFRHVLPNAFGPVVALGLLEFGGALLAISALSFLGFGPPPPAPEWGDMVASGAIYLSTAWWMTTIPGLLIVAVVLSVNTIGRGMRSSVGSMTR
jgi:peptide/nickel transport system permease protein